MKPVPAGTWSQEIVTNPHVPFNAFLVPERPRAGIQNVVMKWLAAHHAQLGVLAPVQFVGTLGVRLGIEAVYMICFFSTIWAVHHFTISSRV